MEVRLILSSASLLYLLILHFHLLSSCICSYPSLVPFFFSLKVLNSSSPISLISISFPSSLNSLSFYLTSLVAYFLISFFPSVHPHFPPFFAHSFASLIKSNEVSSSLVHVEVLWFTQLFDSHYFPSKLLATALRTLSPLARSLFSV